MKYLNDKNFESETKQGIVLIDFFATWCGPCRMQSTIIEEILTKKPDLNIFKIDVDENPNLARKFGIMSIPTLLLLKDGQVVNKHIGLMQQDELLNFYNSSN